MSHDPGLQALLWADQWVAALRAGGIADVCLAPGSRSTALAVAVSRCPEMRAHIHFDERGLGFFALGLARASHRPVALITTSGTAVANLLPAVIEAWHHGVPLVLLTADRPPELRANAANQSIDQVKIFGDYVRWFADIPCPDSALPSSFIASTASHALALSRQGPVHLNLQFRGPFLPEEVPPFSPPLVPRVAPPSFPLPDTEAIAALARQIADAATGVVVLGQMEDEADIQAAGRLVHALGWPVAADLASGLNRVGVVSAAGSWDLFLQPPVELPPPEIFLHLGGRLVSKRLARWIAGQTDSHILRVAPDTQRLDPDLAVRTRVQARVSAFVSALIPHLKVKSLPSDFAAPYEALSRRAADLLASLWEPALDAPLSEVDAVRISRGLLTGEADVFVGNSLPVRIFDSLHGCIPCEKTRWYINRGASGIDGNLATLAGIAAQAPAGRRVVGFVGDLTALHDLNSLLLIARSPVPILLCILNNDGGGIFNHLPVRRQTSAFEPFFAVPHGLRFEGVARMMGLNYQAVSIVAELNEAAEKSISATHSTVLEFKIDREQSRLAWVALMDRLRKNT